MHQKSQRLKKIIKQNTWMFFLFRKFLICFLLICLASRVWEKHIPRCSMYGIFTYMTGWFLGFLCRCQYEPAPWFHTWVLFSNKNDTPSAAKEKHTLTRLRSTMLRSDAFVILSRSPCSKKTDAVCEVSRVDTERLCTRWCARRHREIPSKLLWNPI